MSKKLRVRHGEGSAVSGVTGIHIHGQGCGYFYGPEIARETGCLSAMFDWTWEGSPTSGYPAITMNNDGLEDFLCSREITVLVANYPYPLVWHKWRLVEVTE